MTSAKQINQIAKRGGFLLKKSRSGGWNKRFFCITSAKWMYFKSMDSTTPQFCISKSQILSVNPIRSDTTNCTFSVVSMKKTHILQAQDASDRDEWIQQIQIVMNTSEDHDDELSVSGSETEQIAVHPENVSKFIHEVDVVPETNEISQMFGDTSFDSEEYARAFFSKKSYQKAQAHCQDLAQRRTLSSEEMRKGVYQHYPSFINAAQVIRSMETDVSRLKCFTDQCRETFSAIEESFKTDKLMSWDGIGSDAEIVDSNIVPIENWIKESEVISTLEVYIFERNFAPAVAMIHSKRLEHAEHGTCSKLMEKVETRATELIEMIEHALSPLIDRSEESGTVNSYLEYLIQLERHSLASTYCLKSFSARVDQHMQQILSTGSPVAFVDSCSQRFFTVLLVCVDDYKSLFHTSSSSIFAAMVSWLSKEVGHFVQAMVQHIFPLYGDGFEFTTSNISQLVHQIQYMFECARQLELDGFSIVHVISQTIVPHMLQLLGNYKQFINQLQLDTLRLQLVESSREYLRLLTPAFGTSKLLFQALDCIYEIVDDYSTRLLNSLEQYDGEDLEVHERLEILSELRYSVYDLIPILDEQINSIVEPRLRKRWRETNNTKHLEEKYSAGKDISISAIVQSMGDSFDLGQNELPDISPSTTIQSLLSTLDKTEEPKHLIESLWIRFQQEISNRLATDDLQYGGLNHLIANMRVLEAYGNEKVGIDIEISREAVEKARSEYSIAPTEWFDKYKALYKI